MTKTVAILHAAGTNRDEEAARACSLAGADPRILHVGSLRRGESTLADFDALVLPGGFSYGDALGAGARLALDLDLFLRDVLEEFIQSGKRVLGICNGYQTLVRAGMLPGFNEKKRRVTLTENQNGHFECRWVHLGIESGCRASWLATIEGPIFCPVAHGEGNFQVESPAVVERLEGDGLVAFRYVSPSSQRANGAYPLNPNGSVGDIAGICNPAGNVVGLMPHPEDHVLPIQNPRKDGRGLGLQLFRALVNS